MADFYDMNAAIRPQNYFASFVQGQQAGQQAREFKQQQEDRNAFRALAPQVLAGDPNAFNQAAVIDQKATAGLQDARDSQLLKLEGALNLMDQARKSNNPSAANAALRAISPFMTQITGRPAPDGGYDEATMGPGLDELRAQIAMAKSGGGGNQSILSTYVDDQGNRVAVRRDGTTQVLGGADLGASKQTLTIAGPDGRPRQYTFDRRTGGYMPAGAASEQPQQLTQFTGPDGVRINIDPELPEHVRQDILNDPSAWSQAPDGATAVLPPSETRTSPFVGRTPEEEAAAKRAAEKEVDLRYAPGMAAVEAEAARQKAEAEAEAKRAVTQQERDATYQLYDTAITQLKSGFDGAITFPGMALMPGLTAQQQIAQGGVSAMAPVLKQIFRVAGEGTFTDRDQALLLEMLPTRNDLPAARQAKLDAVDAIVRAKLQQGTPAPARQGGGRRARNPQTGEVLVLMNGQWVPENGR